MEGAGRSFPMRWATMPCRMGEEQCLVARHCMRLVDEGGSQRRGWGGGGSAVAIWGLLHGCPQT